MNYNFMRAINCDEVKVTPFTDHFSYVILNQSLKVDMVYVSLP